YIKSDTSGRRTRSRAVTPRRQSIDGHFIPHSNSNANSDSTFSLRRKSAGDVPNSDGSIFQRSSQVGSENSACGHKALHSEAEEVNGVKIPKSIMRNVSSTAKCHITIVRDAINGFGLSLAGGRDSEPFKENDTGLFISGVVDRGPSEAAGLFVGDKILSVNGVSVVDEPHHVVAEMMQKEDELELLVERDAIASTSYSGCHEEKTKPTQQNGEGRDPITSEEMISTAIEPDLNGSLGFEVEVGDGHVVASVVALNDPGKKTRIQTDETTISGARLYLANSLIADENANEACVVVERQQPSKLEERNAVVSLSQSSLPSTISETPTEGAFTTDTQTEVSLVVDVAEGSDSSAAVAPLATPYAEHTTEDCGFTERLARDQPMETPLSSASLQTGVAVKCATPTHPTPERESPNRVGPPVAPKPKISLNGCEFNASISSKKQQPQSSVSEPEKMTLLSKIRKFESAAQIPHCDPNPNTQQLPPKKPLVSEDDVRKMKEEENKKLAAVTASFPIAIEEYIDDDLSFEHILNNNAIPSCIPRLVRTKNAERRLMAAAKQAMGTDESSNTSDIAETTLSELQKRQMWRQARYKSLEKDTAEAERMMQQVREISNRFGSIAEDGNLLGNVHSTPDESTLNSGGDGDEVCATVLSDDGSELLLKTNIPSMRIST
uniref:PDZ domain-containing protein n=1 Tax=Parascaris univalens TaxID=6257 RepID=A0A915C6C1_PARUN